MAGTCISKNVVSKDATIHAAQHLLTRWSRSYTREERDAPVQGLHGAFAQTGFAQTGMVMQIN